MPVEKLNIPNFELCRCVGKGNYGEVWLAKSISGTWCAIKVVWRKNFPDSESFEQEFNGILYYEPISRSHEGLMKILYVGRDSNNQFYYYVNELADDSHENQGEFIAESYNPSTLTEKIRRHPQGIEIKTLLRISQELLCSVSYLHSKDLIHRDIKPGNIIFIDGKAKLADIGSVSLIGHKALVGTQGYMPPEGPIAKQSDLYSIGKVLYEAFTGLDRLDFPRIPQHKQLITGSRRFNKMICKLANPQLKERYASADLANADIKKIIEGKDLAKTWDRLQLLLLMLAFFLSVGILAVSWGYFTYQEQEDEIQEIKETQGWVKISSNPQGAQVIDLATNQLLGITPLDSLRPFTADEEIQLKFILKGYEPLTMEFSLKAQKLKLLIPTLIKQEEFNLVEVEPALDLEKQQSINFGEKDIWQNSIGLTMVKFEDFYISQTEVTNKAYNKYVQSKGNLEQQVIGKDKFPVVNVLKLNAKIFCRWLTKYERSIGLISEDEYYRLPYDIEWSALLGVKEDASLYPFEREKKGFLKDKKLFKFNQNKKFKNYTANLADIRYQEQFEEAFFIEGYEDGWAQQSPVGSYNPDKNNLYDIIGNVWEWIEDDYYSAQEPAIICRGGGWRTYEPLKLNNTYRNVNQKGFKSDEIGFRVVLSKRPQLTGLNLP